MCLHCWPLFQVQAHAGVHCGSGSVLLEHRTSVNRTGTESKFACREGYPTGRSEVPTKECNRRVCVPTQCTPIVVPNSNRQVCVRTQCYQCRRSCTPQWPPRLCAPVHPQCTQSAHQQLQRRCKGQLSGQYPTGTSRAHQGTAPAAGAAQAVAAWTCGRQAAGTLQGSLCGGSPPATQCGPLFVCPSQRQGQAPGHPGPRAAPPGRIRLWPR